MASEEDITASAEPRADGGAVAAAAGAKAFASFVASQGPNLIAELRKRPFVHNVYFNGLLGPHQIVGLRLTNPHPDVVYLRNFSIERPSLRYKVTHVLKSDHSKLKPHQLDLDGGISFGGGRPAFDADGGLTADGQSANLMDMMDQNGLGVPPLGSVDLLVVIKRTDGHAYEMEAIGMKLSSEGFRGKIADTSIDLTLRNLPLS
jgi:hypothetical protein